MATDTRPICLTCRGTGRKSRASKLPCEACGGSGRQPYYRGCYWANLAMVRRLIHTDETFRQALIREYCQDKPVQTSRGELRKEVWNRRNRNRRRNKTSRASRRRG